MRPKAVKMDALRVRPIAPAIASDARPFGERPRMAAIEGLVPPRTAMSTPRNRTPRVARQAVNATPATPASAPKRASGPSMPNRVAATIADAVPTRKSRSRDMAAHRTGVLRVRARTTPGR